MKEIHLLCQHGHQTARLTVAGRSDAGNKSANSCRFDWLLDCCKLPRPIIQVSGRRLQKVLDGTCQIIKIYIFGVLALRSIDWYIYGSNRKGGGRVFRPPPPKFYWATPTKI